METALAESLLVETMLTFYIETPQPNKTNIEHRKTHTAARACQYTAATAPRTVHLTQVRGWFLGGTCNSVQEQCATLDFLIYSVSARATILSELSHRQTVLLEPTPSKYVQ